MTDDKNWKRLVRARMARTGERYSTARAALLTEHEAQHPPRARHDQTFALLRLLEALDLADGIDEAWLLGLGGGVSVQAHAFSWTGADPTLYLGTRANPQYAYTADFLERAVRGLGHTPEVFETGGRRAAEKQLVEALSEGPVIAWVGREALLDVPERAGATPWVALVRDLDEESDVAAVLDVDAGAIELPLDRLLDARARLKKGRNRLLRLRPGSAPPPDAVSRALTHCLEDLRGEHPAGGPAANYGIGALELFADRMSQGGKRGWRDTFAAGRPFLAGAADAWRWVEGVTGGGGFRDLYADFLDRAERPEAARAYRALARQWTGMVEALLDPAVPLLVELRAALVAAPNDSVAPLLARADEVPPAWFEAALERRISDLREIAHLEREAAALLSP